VKIITNSIKRTHFIKDLKLGTQKKFQIKITKKLHYDFSKFTGDKSLIHSSKKFCKANNFKSIVGYGFLITAILSKLYGMYFPGGSELCLQQTCNFKKPYYINDILVFKLKLTQINKFNKLVTIETRVLRNSKELIFEGNALLQLSLDKKK
tara:strand:+ start:1587 stop:2039 length:453 start_codon:yes stop_codon:yes gene_type:complete